MSNFVEINGDPDEIRARGARLAARGRGFEARAQNLVDRIAGIEGGAPWGGDGPGAEFLKPYKSTEHTEEPFNEYVKNGANGLGQKLTRTGEAIENAMIGYQFADLDNESDIADVRE